MLLMYRAVLSRKQWQVKQWMQQPANEKSAGERGADARNGQSGEQKQCAARLDETIGSSLGCERTAGC